MWSNFPSLAHWDYYGDFSVADTLSEDGHERWRGLEAGTVATRRLSVLFQGIRMKLLCYSLSYLKVERMIPLFSSSSISWTLTGWPPLKGQRSLKPTLSRILIWSMLCWSQGSYWTHRGESLVTVSSWHLWTPVAARLRVIGQDRVRVHLQFHRVTFFYLLTKF